jgi:hypothetical protein
MKLSKILPMAVRPDPSKTSAVAKAMADTAGCSECLANRLEGSPEGPMRPYKSIKKGMQVCIPFFV